MSMDINEESYYGEISEINEQYVVSGLVKKSTKSFKEYTSVYLSYKDIKINLAVLPVRKGVELVEYVKLLMSIVEKLSIKYDVPLLDKGYYSVPVFNYCKENQIPLIMPVKRKGKKIIAWLDRKVPGRHEYTVRSHKHGSARVDVIEDQRRLKRDY